MQWEHTFFFWIHGCYILHLFGVACSKAIVIVKSDKQLVSPTCALGLGLGLCHVSIQQITYNCPLLMYRFLSCGHEMMKSSLS